MATENDRVQKLYFNDHEWDTIEAAMARIIPTDHEPGAREAKTVRFVDRYLSGINYVYAKPDGNGFRALSGKEADVWQARIDNLRRIYAEGILEIDRIAQRHFQTDFVNLSIDRQDSVLEELSRPSQPEEARIEEAGTVAAFAAPTASMQQAVNEHSLDFFPLLALHTRQGFYADPVYGGNHNHVGWKTIGFPGPQSMAEVHHGKYSTLPYFAEQGLADGAGGVG